MYTSPNKYKKSFLISDVANDIKRQLLLMENDPTFATNSMYSPASEVEISFTDKHLTYLSAHPMVKPKEYMANLRLKTRLRR
jgi:hypothetical protein